MPVNSLNQLPSRAIIGRYYETLEGVSLANWVNAISMPFTSDQDSETYKWLGMTPAMREWVGGRQAKGLRTGGITVDNVHYESTLDIPVEDIRRDKTSQIMLRVDELAARSVQHWNGLLSTLINNGASTACYDGQFFFDTDHSEGDSGTLSNDLEAGTYANLNVGTATAPTADEMAKCILDVAMHFYTFKDDQGEPLNEDANQFVVMAGANPIGTAAKLAVSQNMLDTGSGTRDNPIKGAGLMIDAVINPRITSTTAFYVFRTDGRVKPLIRQTETDGELKAIAEGSELEFNDGIWRFGVDAWRAVGYGLWQHACMATLS